MADTRLQAVATADDRRRTVSAGIRESVAAFAVADPTGHSSSGASAVAVPFQPFAAGQAAGPSALVQAFIQAFICAFAHTFQPLRPTFVRVATAVRSGHPHGRSSRAGLPCSRRALVLGALGQSVPQEGVTHFLWKAVMGTDRDLSTVAGF